MKTNLKIFHLNHLDLVPLCKINTIMPPYNNFLNFNFFYFRHSQFKSDMTKLIEKFDRCLSYLSHLAISRENAVAQPTENWKSVNYLLNYPRNLKITLKMYWDHLHLIIIDEYEKVYYSFKRTTLKVRVNYI